MDAYEIPHCLNNPSATGPVFPPLDFETTSVGNDQSKLMPHFASLRGNEQACLKIGPNQEAFMDFYAREVFPKFLLRASHRVLSTALPISDKGREEDR